MFNQKLSQQLTWAILITLVMVGCSTPADAPAPDIEVIFDGNECIVSGPTKVTTGKLVIALKDLSGEIDDLQALRLLDGHTHQDLLDLQNEPGENNKEHVPKRQSLRIGKSWNDSIGGEVYPFYLYAEGEYSISIASFNLKRAWYCAPLKVIEAPSE
jgi:hypothetical protein